MISPVEGELRVRKDAELDRENIPFYNLTIAARDRGVPPLSSTVSPSGQRGGGAAGCRPPCPAPSSGMGGMEKGAMCLHHFSSRQMLVGIRVLDINDNDPVLLNLPMNITLSENAPVSSFVTRVLARDADKGPNALLTFNITSGNTENAFYINSTVRPQGGGVPGHGGSHGCLLAPCPGRRSPRGDAPHVPSTYFLPFFLVERHCLRKPPAGQGAGGGVQADRHGEGQPREHTQCQAGNYGHCQGLQRHRQPGGWEKGLLPWPKPGGAGAFTHSISNSSFIPRKHLGVTRRGAATPRPSDNRTSRI